MGGLEGEVVGGWARGRDIGGVGGLEGEVVGGGGLEGEVVG